MAVLHIGNDVLTAFCPQCKCCLADGGHCANCHTKKAVTTLCGCGECEGKVQDYLERVKLRAEKLRLQQLAKVNTNG